MHGFRRGLAALSCVVLLAGCSVISGRTSTETRRTGVPRTSSAPGSRVPGPAFTAKRTVAAVLAAAGHDFETVYTYDYRHLEKYRSAGLRVTTAPYSSSYSSALQGHAAATLKSGQYVQLATANLSGLAGLSRDGTQATAVVSGTLATTSTHSPAGTNKNVTVVLKLKRSGSTWRISSSQPGAAAQGSVPANAALRKAMSAARTAMTRIYGLHRASFDADYAKALAITTDTLHDSMSENEPSVRQSLQAGKYDLSAKIVGFAVLQPAADVTCIVTVDEFHVGRQDAELGPYRHVLAVVVTDVDGSWRVRSATPLS